MTVAPSNHTKLQLHNCKLNGDISVTSDTHPCDRYSRVYCIHIYNKKQELVLYHLTKDNVIKKLGIDLHTNGTVFVHVIDNLLITHNVEQKVRGHAIAP